MNEKVSLFFENTRILSDTFGITPLLYGSLGLEYLTGENLNADDIDILIPQVYIKEKWEEISFKVQKEYLKAFPRLENKYCACLCDSADGVKL